MGKKNPYVFTIGFDKKNPEHLEVVEILNGTEKKAALIAEAILLFFVKYFSLKKASEFPFFSK